MTTIVIPDIHNQVGWIEPALEFLKKKHNYDEVVFLGDYFDSFYDVAFNAQATAVWLKQSLTHSDRIHLLGNHDMPYMVPGNPSLWCPGFSRGKLNVIRSTLTNEDWEKFRGAYYSQGYLFSHAGFHPDLITHPVNGIPTPENLVIQAAEGLKQVRGGVWHLLYLPGRRMGELRNGGITWQDWDDEFKPVEGINQIVGHTPSRETYDRPKVDLSNLSQNWCLDRCGDNHFIGIIEDGKISFTTRKKIEYERQNSSILEDTGKSVGEPGE